MGVVHTHTSCNASNITVARVYAHGLLPQASISSLVTVQILFVNSGTVLTRSVTVPGQVYARPHRRRVSRITGLVDTIVFNVQGRSICYDQ
jgi:hypothetical protein